VVSLKVPYLRYPGYEIRIYWGRLRHKRAGAPPDAFRLRCMQAAVAYTERYGRIEGGRVTLPRPVKVRLLRIWRRLPGWARNMIERLLLPKFLVGGVAVVFDDRGRVLLFRHTYRDRYPWGLPGGWLKGGEDPIDAVEREVYEESGYRVKALHPLVIGGDRDTRRLDLIFLCDLEGGAFRSSAEVSAAGFHSLDELPGLVEPFHVDVVTYGTEVLAGRIRGQPRIPARSPWTSE
jgi:8-oxo-dGTP diphosphatase